MAAPVLPARRRTQPLVSWMEMRRWLSQGTQIMREGALTPAAWPAANRAIYLPVEWEAPMTVTHVAMISQTAVGSWDIGVYNLDGVRLFSTGLVTMTAGVQTQALGTPVRVPRGWGYLAALCTSGSAVVYCHNTGAGASDWIGWGGLQEATGGTLPAVATFATNTTAYVPAFGIFAAAP